MGGRDKRVAWSVHARDSPIRNTSHLPDGVDPTSPFDDEEWESLSTAYNGWLDDVGDILAGLVDASENAERSLEDQALARRVVHNLRERIRAAVQEIADRTNEMTGRLAHLQR